MRPAFFSGVAPVILLACMLAAEPQKEATKVETKLWAAITVNRPVFTQGDVSKRVIISFGVVNDGAQVVNPQPVLDKSQLIVNGKGLKNWDITIASGPRDERFFALPAGEYLMFSYDLREHFRAPGIYKVSWKGKGFEAKEIVFRVLAE